MNDILISIIVPAYNIEKWLSRCLDSIIKQTYKNLEIIVIDDGSTDDTYTIIEEYEKRDARIVGIHKSNGGVTSARLDGIKQATGEWIGFVDGDDIIEPDMYEFLLNNAIKYSSSISHCGYQMIFEDGRTHYFHNSGVLIQHNTVEALKSLLDGSLIEPGLWNKLYRKDLFFNIIQSNIIDRNIKQNEDLLMNFILFNNCNKSVFCDVCKYHYIVRQGSATRQTLNNNIIYDPILVKETILNLALPDIRKDAQRAYISTCVDIYNLILMSNDSDYLCELNNVRRLIIEHRSWVKLLGKKRQILALMIMKNEKFYKIFYKFYSNYFQEKKYE